MLTLEEAIAHCKEKAEENRFVASCYTHLDNKRVKAKHDDCLECAREHEQLAEWLTELKQRREADKWVITNERLPSDDEPYEVLCCDNHGEIMIGHPFADEESECGYSAENEGCFMYECIAWKLLPEPHKENDK